jgi:hypothetical protein
MRRLLAAAVLVVLGTGCYADTFSYPGTSATGGTDTGIPGTYTLQTVNGQTLPYTYYQSGADSYVLLDDTVTLTAGGSWTESWHEQHTVSGVVTNPAFSDGGTYTAAGTALSFTSTKPGTNMGTFNGTGGGGTLNLPGQFSTNGPVLTMVYTK